MAKSHPSGQQKSFWIGDGIRFAGRERMSKVS